MSYTPNNVCVYLSAFAGALAGLAATGKYLTDASEGDYALPAEQADAFAQATDMAWGNASYTNVDLQQIQSCSQGVWVSRSPLKNDGGTSVTPSSYTGLAESVVAVVQAGTRQISSEGVDPNGCGGAGTGNASWLVTDWYINPVTGNDGAAGTSPTTPVKTYTGGIVNKWGTRSPTLAQTTTIHLLAGETVEQESAIISPILVNGSNFILRGVPIAHGATFSPSVVVAKNRATPQLLELEGLPAGTAAGMLIQNVTKASYAFVDSVVSNTGVITQPFDNDGLTTVITAEGSNPLEVNTWSSTDTYQLFDLPIFNLKQLQPSGGDSKDTTLESPVTWIQWVRIPDVSGTPGYSRYTAAPNGCSIVHSMCWFDSVFVGINLTNNIGSMNLGCWHNGSSDMQAWWAIGGAIGLGSFFLNAAYFTNLSGPDGDIIIHAPIIVKGGYSVCGFVYADNNDSTIAGSQLRIEPFFYSTGQLWGPGGMDVDGGGALLNETNGSWAACFTLTGVLSLEGVTSGSAYNDPTAGLWTNGITISAANLDTHSGLQNPITGSKYAII